MSLPSSPPRGRSARFARVAGGSLLALLLVTQAWAGALQSWTPISQEPLQACDGVVRDLGVGYPGPIRIRSIHLTTSEYVGIQIWSPTAGNLAYLWTMPGEPTRKEFLFAPDYLTLPADTKFFAWCWNPAQTFPVAYATIFYVYP